MGAAFLLWFSTYSRDLVVVLLALAFGYATWGAERWTASTLPLLIAAGLGELSLLVCLLSLVHAFTPLAMVFLCGGVLFASGARLLAHRTTFNVRDINSAFLRTLRHHAVSAGMLMALFVLLSILPLYPTLGFDSSLYHLPLAQDLVSHHGFADNPYTLNYFVPQANEALFAICLLISGSSLVAQGIELFCFALTAWLVYAVVLDLRRGRAAALVAGLLVCASPIAVSSATNAYVDIWPLLFLTAMFVVISLAVAGLIRRDTVPCALAGFLGGQAAAGKYNALAFVAAIVVGLLASRAVRVREIRVGAAIAGLAAALIVLLPWYGRTTFLTGDPIYPLFTSIFGNHGGWTAAEIAIITQPDRSAGPTFADPALQDLRYELGLNPGNLVAIGLPWLSYALGLGFFGALFDGLRKDPIWRAAIIGGALMILAWGLVSANPRLLVPATGVLAIAGGITVGRIADALGGEVGRVGVVAAAGLATVVLSSSTILYTMNVWRSYGPPPTTRGAINTMLLADINCLDGVEYLDERFRGNYSAYGIHCENTTYYAAGRWLGGWAGPGSYGRILGPNWMLPPTTVASNLRHWGAQFVIVQRVMFGPRAHALLRDTGDFQLAFVGPYSVVLAVR